MLSIISRIKKSETVDAIVTDAARGIARKVVEPELKDLRSDARWYGSSSLISAAMAVFWTRNTYVSVKNWRQVRTTLKGIDKGIDSAVDSAVDQVIVSPNGTMPAAEEADKANKANKAA